MADELEGLLAQAGIQYGTQEELAEKAENKQPEKPEEKKPEESDKKTEQEKKPEPPDRLKIFGEVFGREFKEVTGIQLKLAADTARMVDANG